MRNHLPSPGRCGAVLVATLLAAGCADDPAAPTSRRPAGPSAASVASRPQLIPNGVRYRDTGHRAASARSGSAQLALRALLDIQGVTTVEVTTGVFDSLPTPGSITRLQVKGFAPNDSLLFTLNENGLAGGGTASLQTRGLSRGFLVQAQANVRGIDGLRTDVVAVRDTVVFRPDLVVGKLQLPLDVRPGVPLVFSAAVSEIRGSLGARATCRLYVDGAAADSALGIWVNAGGMVTCAFQHVFPAAGSYQVEVRAEDVAPGDYDPSNNARGTTVSVNANAFGYSASVTYQLVTSWHSDSSYWALLDGSAGNNYAGEWGDSTFSQDASLFASMPRTVSFPIARLRLAQLVGTATVHDTTLWFVPADYTYTDPDSTYSCLHRYGLGWWFWLCSGVRAGTPSTYLGYGRWAGEVVYYSAGISSSWSADGTYFYSWNSWWSDGAWGLWAPAGATYDFLVAFSEGGRYWATYPKVVLQPFGGSYDAQPNCYGEIVDWASPPYRYSYCSRSGTRWTGLQGTAQGPPDPVTLTP